MEKMEREGSFSLIIGKLAVRIYHFVRRGFQWEGRGNMGVPKSEEFQSMLHIYVCR
jgi:hypothetical protein